MTVRQALVSATFEDEKGERVAAPFYFTTDDANTLANILSYAGTVAAQMEALSSSELLRVRIVLNAPLPGGIKTDPDAGSDNEETGLFTLALTSPSSKSFSVDIPAINPVVMDATHPNIIDQANAAVIAFVTTLTTAGTGTPTNNLWSSAITGVRSAIKTFRKHRRAAKRT